jgi:serine/threonine-protein kinase
LGALAAALAAHYTLERELGRGGMGTVWLARDLRHDRPVALKVLSPELALALGGERFLREIRLTARLQHPHIVPIHDSGESAGFLWYTMAYVDGETVRHRLARESGLPVAAALRIARDAAAGLAAAHAQGVVHRDIKPENLLLTTGGETLVADFGLAILERDDATRLTATGVSLGTPAYMAPEQIAGEATDARTDVYGLGCVLFEMLAGRPPFIGATAAEVMGRRFQAAPPLLRTVRADVPAGVEAAVARALGLAPAERFPSVEAFAAVLDRPLAAAGPRWWARGLVAAAVLAGAAGVAGTAFVAHRRASRVESATLAVLPVRDLDHGDTSAFAAGLTEDLTAAAAEVPGLLVVSSHSAAAARRDAEDPRTIGRRLGVSTIVESTVRLADARLRMVVRLVRTSDGGVIWSERYDRPREDILTLQDELAAAVAGALRVRYAEGRHAPGEPRLVDPAAYDLYARATQLQERSRSLAELQMAATLLDSAIALDSSFARAYALLATVHLQLYDFGMPIAELEPRTAATVSAGLRFAPDEPRLLAAASVAMQRAGRGDSAEALLRRGVGLAPGDAWMQSAWAGFLVGRVRLEEARQADLLAVQLAPLDPFALSITSWGLVTVGAHADALRAADQARAIDSGQRFPDLTRAVARACRGEWNGVFGDLERGQDLGFFWQAILGFAHALHGDTAAALVAARAVTALAEEGKAQPISPGWIYAGLGWADSAFAWVDRANRAHGVYTGVTDFFFDGLASDPRWIASATRDIGAGPALAARDRLLRQPRCRPEHPTRSGAPS